MKDVGTWLESFGLGRYAEAFERGDIDWEILPELDHETLKDLGVESPGDRLRILKAIKTLTPGAGRNQPLSRPPGPPPTPSRAERRQLTVLFCDMVGSTALSERLDPEDMREIMTTYQNLAAGVISRFEGHVARLMGDGVLAYFGWPQAHEDDAERAVRAGLELVDAVGELAVDGTELAVRVGIATGQVVVGDLIGEGAAQEHAVVGRTPNLAARLQEVAQPASVVIAASTRQLLGGLFELADLGKQQLKGLAEPLHAYRIEGEIRDQGRFEALHGRSPLPLIGREHELGLMVERWELARHGEGQAVLVAGEPGIGKSRLVQALLDRIEDEPHTRIRCYSSHYLNNTALHPIVGALERAANFKADDTRDTKLDKLEAALRLSGTDLAEYAPFLALLCDLSGVERYAAIDLSPQAQKAKTFEGLLRHVEGLAAEQPVAMILEDAHWADPTTRELFGHLIERTRELPVLLVITFRPEFTPPWIGHGHVTSLSLSRLGQRQGMAIAESLAGGKALPDQVVAEIMAKTDGVPLFVEELTRSVIESKLLVDAGDHYELTSPHGSVAIPATLHDSLMARLDRLGAVKEVAQIASVIGREFSHTLLSQVSSLSMQELDRSIAELLHAGIIHRRGTPPDVTYSFKHALVRDSAYESLLKSTRQELHLKVAEILEAEFHQVVESEPEFAAYHFMQSGKAERACDYLLLAGQRAVQRSANAEAIAHLETALDLLKPLTEAPERLERELRILTLLGPALLVTKSRTTDEVAETFERARQLAQKLGDTDRIAPATLGLWYFHMNRGNFVNAGNLIEELFELADRSDDDSFVLQAHHAAWTTPLFTGEFEEVRRHVQEGIHLYDQEDHGRHSFVYIGHDPYACALSIGAIAMWMLGFPDQALQYSEDAVGFAQEIGHAPSLVHALALAGNLHVLRSDHRRVAAVGERLHAIAGELSMAPARAVADCLTGWALLRDGARDEGFARLERGVNAWRSAGTRLHLPQRLGMLADGLSLTGDLERALEVNAEARRVAVETGERWCEALLIWQRGELLAALASDPERIMKAYRESMNVARQQQSKSAELRAAVSLAKLLAARGLPERAREELEPVHGWFTEGFETEDLVAARDLLDKLD